MAFVDRNRAHEIDLNPIERKYGQLKCNSTLFQPMFEDQTSS